MAPVLWLLRTLTYKADETLMARLAPELRGMTNRNDGFPASEWNPVLLAFVGITASWSPSALPEARCRTPG